MIRKSVSAYAIVDIGDTYIDKIFKGGAVLRLTTSRPAIAEGMAQ